MIAIIGRGVVSSFRRLYFFSSFIIACAIRVNSAVPPGSLDWSFQGRATATVENLLLAPEGKIFVKLGWPIYSMTRLQGDGAADPTFTPGVPAGSKINAVGLQPDGKIIVAGDFLYIHGVPRPCLARLNTDCSLDPDFIPQLTITNPPPPVGPPLPPGWSVATNSIGFVSVQSDGGILIGAMNNILAANGSPLPRLIRLNPDGSRDNSFVGITNAADRIVVQPDGKILVARNLYYNPWPGSSTLYRFNSDGTPDAAFASPVIQGYVNALFVQSNKIVIAGGIYRVNGLSAGLVARLNDDGTLDVSFQADLWPGVIGVATAILNLMERCWSVAASLCQPRHSEILRV
jgi:uncharacterized delta-60 repeat protein